MQDGLSSLLPEEFPYEDDGCELWPHCLSCPFPTCIKEEPWGVEKFTKLQRARRMAELKQEGKANEEIGRIFGVSTRTVQRWLKVMREARGRDSSVASLPQNDKVGGSPWLPARNFVAQGKAAHNDKSWVGYSLAIVTRPFLMAITTA